MTITESEKDLDCIESDTDKKTQVTMGDIMASGYQKIL